MQASRTSRNVLRRRACVDHNVDVPALTTGTNSTGQHGNSETRQGNMEILLFDYYHHSSLTHLIPRNDFRFPVNIQKVGVRFITYILCMVHNIHFVYVLHKKHTQNIHYITYILCRFLCIMQYVDIIPNRLYNS